MTSQSGFLLDENINPAVADGLRRNALEAVSARELNLLSASDHEILERAIEQKKILVTRDIRDFLALARLYLERGRPFPGLLLVSPAIPARDPGALIDAIIAWTERYGSLERITGGIAWLTPADRPDSDRRVREARPGYLRALERIGATI
jgi:predicted nuclease of predicted toxin-antitoxin system